MAKLILILLAWPVGTRVLWVVIAEGYRQEPFALAVHEMLFIFIVVLLMVLSIVFSPRGSGGLYSAIRHIAYYFLIAAFSSLLNFLFFILPYSQNTYYDGSIMVVIGISALLLVTLLGTFLLYREIVMKKA